MGGYDGHDDDLDPGDDPAVRAEMAALFETALEDEPASALTPLSVLREAKRRTRADGPARSGRGHGRGRRTAWTWGGGALVAAAAVGLALLVGPSLFGGAGQTASMSEPNVAAGAAGSVAAGSVAAGSASDALSGSGDEAASRADAGGAESLPSNERNAAPSAAAVPGASPQAAPQASPCPARPALSKAERAAVTRVVPKATIAASEVAAPCVPGAERASTVDLPGGRSVLIVVTDSEHSPPTEENELTEGVVASGGGHTVLIMFAPGSASPPLPPATLDDLAQAVLDAAR